MQLLAEYASDLCQILTCMLLLVKPVREWILGTEALREGQRCLLRSEILRIYYRHGKDKQLQEYEYRNLIQCYQGYKALGGNSFVEHVYEEMQDWEIV
jgi:hypothetical protein